MTDLDINSKPLYVSAYGKDGRRITSYVVGIHGDNIEAIEDKLKKNTPILLSLRRLLKNGERQLL